MALLLFGETRVQNDIEIYPRNSVADSHEFVQVSARWRRKTRQDRSAPVPDASVIADGTVDHLVSIFTQSINPR
jgi:hypothetical protein